MMRFFDFLFPPRVDEIALRGISADDFSALANARLAPETRPGTVTLLSFNDARVRSAVHEAKYHGSERAFELLGSVLADYLRDCDENYGRTGSAIVVPVPLGRERLRERGFNQVYEVTLRALRCLGEEGGVRLENNLLVRVRETASQVSLARERREENMRGAFGAARPADPAQTYFVIDDVLTTGATLQAAVDALKGAGALHIVPLALAH